MDQVVLIKTVLKYFLLPGGYTDNATAMWLIQILVEIAVNFVPHIG